MSAAAANATQFALPRYLSPQTQEMCAMLGRHGRTLDDLAVDMPQLPSSNTAGHTVGYPMIMGVPAYHPSYANSNPTDYSTERNRPHKNGLFPLLHGVHRHPGLWLRIGVLLFAMVAAPLFYTAFVELQQDEHARFLHIRTDPLLYVASAAFASLALAIISLPIHLLAMPYIVCCALTVADSAMLLLWLVASFLSLNPTEDAENPRSFVCNPLQTFHEHAIKLNLAADDYHRVCTRIKAGTVFAFFSVTVYILLLGGSLLRVRQCRLNYYNNKHTI
jgi:hypothetical protein